MKSSSALRICFSEHNSTSLPSALGVLARPFSLEGVVEGVLENEKDGVSQRALATVKIIYLAL
jgi:hypothetical protein